LQHALTAGSGSVDLKEYEKKNTVLQQCREKIESVCFDLRLRKVRRDGARRAITSRNVCSNWCASHVTDGAGRVPAH
jgi:hypothetical protein